MGTSGCCRIDICLVSWNSNACAKAFAAKIQGNTVIQWMPRWIVDEAVGRQTDRSRSDPAEAGLSIERLTIGHGQGRMELRLLLQEGRDSSTRALALASG
jgi:hypothetical protein